MALIANGRCDAALVDVNLGGPPVDELALLLRQKTVPFAFVTGHDREALPAGFREAPMVSKPFQEEQLLATVQQLISGRTAAAGVIQFKPRK